MARYRKNSVVVEAEQWFPGKRVDGVLEVARYVGANGSIWPAYAVVKKLRDATIAHAGDWIVTEPSGERHVCEPDIFEQIYEPVEEVKK